MRLVMLFCSIALLSALTVVLDAAADTETPDALGSIAGLVTNDAGEPLAGIDVYLYKQIPYPVLLRTVTTDVEGGYLFPALAAGIYHVEYRDPAGVYAFQFYREKNALFLADEVTVAGAPRTGIDASLVRGGSITGLITTTRTASVTFTYLRLYREHAPGEWHEFSDAQVETGVGPYRFAGLATGIYHLCVSAQTDETPFEECYQNFRIYQPVAETTPISVSAGMTTTGIDFLLGDLVNEPTLAGIVTAPDGAPLAGIEVTLWEDGVSGWNPQRTQFTRSNGAFRFRYVSQEARYALAFADPAGNYAREFFNNAVDVDHATVVELGDELLRDDLNATLALGGRITGVVTINGEVAPIQGSVRAFRRLGDESVPAWTSSVDPAMGQYTIGGLPSGAYRIAAGAFWDLISLSGYYGGADWESATPVEVTAGETVPSINIDLGRFNSTITGTVSYLGVPQPGLKVTLAPLDPFSGLDARHTVYTYTDAAGVYRLDGLGANRYTVRVTDPTGHYAATYYQAGAEAPWPTPVTIPADTVVPNINVELTLAGAIQGQLLRYNGTPVPGATVYAYLLRPDGWLALLLDQVHTDAQGSYRLQGLLPGRYLLYFVDPVRPEWSEYYNSSPGPETAQELIVQAELTTFAGESILGPDVALHLPVIGR
jgi:5-hydroxyisourate hydrolase-like protein (transthyretin family)